MNDKNKAAQATPALDPAGGEAANWFFENSLDVFLVTRDREILRVNRAWTSLTGWSAEETAGARFVSFCHPDDAAAIELIRSTLNETGLSEADHRIRTKDGRWLWMRSRAKRGSGGASLIVLRDITEERAKASEAEDERRSRELLREAAGVYMWRFDPSSQTYSFDRDAVLKAGDAAQASQPRAAIDVRRDIHPDDTAAVDRAWAHTTMTGEFQAVEYRRRSRKGRYTYYRAAWRGERRQPSGLWEIIGVTQDITELATARDAAIQGEAAAQSAAETKAQFLANMSHEIRTPLNGVLGVLHLLKSEPLGGEGRAMLDEALACGAMLGELLNDVIDFSKIEAGRLALSPEPVEAAAALEGVASLLRAQAEARGLYLRTEADPALGWISIDPVRLRQTLFNLIGNAVKFTLEGGVEARLSVRGDGDERRMRVEVQDSGIGIAPEAQGVLFERFRQADGSTTRRFGGSGLGLSISRRLVEMMGGEMGLQSTPGSGSTFWFEVPAPAVAAPASADGDDAPILQGLRLLVVEDNRTNQLIISKMLENLGASVTVAENGQEGLSEAAQGGFDLIFMDVQMPVMDGVEATKAIRALASPASSTPIIAMTANALAHQTESYRQAGMDGAVSKPLSPTAILSEIVRVFEAREDGVQSPHASAAG